MCEASCIVTWTRNVSWFAENYRTTMLQLEAKGKCEDDYYDSSIDSSISAGNRVCFSWLSMIQFPYPIFNVSSPCRILNPRRKIRILDTLGKITVKKVISNIHCPLGLLVRSGNGKTRSYKCVIITPPILLMGAGYRVDLWWGKSKQKGKDGDSDAVRNNLCNIFATITCTLEYLPRNFENKFMSIYKYKK